MTKATMGGHNTWAYEQTRMTQIKTNKREAKKRVCKAAFLLLNESHLNGFLTKEENPDLSEIEITLLNEAWDNLLNELLRKSL